MPNLQHPYSKKLTFVNSAASENVISLAVSIINFIPVTNSNPIFLTNLDEMGG